MKKLSFIILFPFITYCCITKTNQTVDEPQNIINTRNIFTINKIKSCAVYKYTYKFGVIDSLSKKLTSLNEYDKLGNLSSQLFNDNITKYKYQDTTLIESVSYDMTGEINEKRRFYYNGKSIIDSIYDKGGLYAGRIIKYVDSYGRDSISTDYDKKGKATLILKRFYDNLGLKQFDWIDLEDDAYSTFSYRLSNDKSINKTIEKYRNGNISYENTEYYNDKGLIESYIRYTYYSGKRNYIKSEYHYIDSTELIDKRIFYQESGEPQYIHIYEYTYF